PLPLDPALLLEPEERGIQRALVEVEDLARDLVQPLGDAVAVHAAEGIERLEHHEVEGALQDVGFWLGHGSLLLGINMTLLLDGNMSQKVGGSNGELRAAALRRDTKWRRSSTTSVSPAGCCGRTGASP